MSDPVIDNAEASAAMTRYLIERGHRRITMILAEGRGELRQSRLAQIPGGKFIDRGQHGLKTAPQSRQGTGHG